MENQVGAVFEGLKAVEIVHESCPLEELVRLVCRTPSSQ